MPDETAKAPGLGIGFTPPDPAPKGKAPPATLFAPPETSPAVPPETSSDDRTPGTADAVVDWTKIDLRRGKEADVPEKDRETFRHLQKQYREMQAENSRRQQDIDRRERELEGRMQRLEQIEKRLTEAPPTPATKAEAGNAARKVADMLQDPELDEDTRSALELMQQAFEEMWQERIGDRVEKIDRIIPRIEHMEAGERQAERSVLVRQIDETRDLYGDDIDSHTDAIMWRCGYEWDRTTKDWTLVRPAKINPSTGQPHTVMSAYELEAGITSMKAAALRKQDGDIKDKAKKGAAPLPLTPSPPDTSEISESEARSQARAMGFGRR